MAEDKSTNSRDQRGTLHITHLITACPLRPLPAVREATQWGGLAGILLRRSLHPPDLTLVVTASWVGHIVQNGHSAL